MGEKLKREEMEVWIPIAAMRNILLTLILCQPL